MDKRGQKLRQSVQMVLLRLQDNEAFQRVEIETPTEAQVFVLDPLNPRVLRSQQGKQLSPSDLPEYLAAVMARAERGSIRFVERAPW